MRINSSALARPLGPRNAAIVGTMLVLGGASYCTLYDLLVCEDHSAGYASAWAAATVLPWLAAFEGNKVVLRRMSETRQRAAAIAMVLLLTLIVSGVVHWLVFVHDGISAGSFAGLHAISHFPETIIVALLTVLAALLTSSTPRQGRRGGATELPVDPAHIYWLKSAGNYVEFRTDGRSHICRMPLRQAQGLLDPERFVRISRSVIVNRDAILPNSSGLLGRVRLVDGSEHRIGDAYRAEIARLA